MREQNIRYSYARHDFTRYEFVVKSRENVYTRRRINDARVIKIQAKIVFTCVLIKHIVKGSE